jgi:GH15 family glucan-1,4-alpha-glucosidase
MRALKLTADGDWYARTGELFLRWQGAPDAVPIARGRGLEMELTVAPGTPRDLVLEISDEKLPNDPPNPGTLWSMTESAWHRQIPPMNQTIAPRDASHSFAVMRGLTGSAGGMVAAATTSLPERVEAGRNYDYRYVWIRDQCYAIQAAAAARQEQWCDDAVRFVIERLIEHGPGMAPAYTVDGSRIPTSRRIGLPGYPGGYDQVGNHVSDQFQLDAFGESLLALAAVADAGRLGVDGQRAADLAVRAIAERWQEPDAGVWELAPRRWAQSRLSCVAGLRAIAGSGHLGRGSARCIELADRLVAEVDRTCLHPSGRWQRAPEDDAVDGALLLPALRGAIPADDPRSTATLDSFVRELTHDHFAYRYRHNGRPLGEAEGSFLLCGFLTALAYHQQGEQLEAVRWFERTRSAYGHSGLYAEEYDVTQRQLRGNLPQAFVHALMLESAVRLADPWR